MKKIIACIFIFAFIAIFMYNSNPQNTAVSNKDLDNFISLSESYAKSIGFDYYFYYDFENENTVISCVLKPKNGDDNDIDLHLYSDAHYEFYFNPVTYSEFKNYTVRFFSIINDSSYYSISEKKVDNFLEEFKNEDFKHGENKNDSLPFRFFGDERIEASKYYDNDLKETLYDVYYSNILKLD